MAKFFSHASGNGFRANANEELAFPIPSGADIATFDEDSNASLVADIRSGSDPFTVVSGQLRKNNVAVAITPDGQDKQDRDDFKANLAAALTRLDVIISQTQAGMTNVQRDNAIGDLARMTKRLLRRLHLIVR